MPAHPKRNSIAEARDALIAGLAKYPVQKLPAAPLGEEVEWKGEELRKIVVLVDAFQNAVLTDVAMVTPLSPYDERTHARFFATYYDDFLAPDLEECARSVETYRLQAAE
jgi:hypothetical protein